MGQTADDLRMEIEQRRSDVGHDLDAIGDRISPARMAERRNARMQQRVGAIRDRVMGVAESARSTVSDVGEGLGERRERAGSAVHDLPDAARHQAQSAEQTVAGAPLVAGLVAMGAGMLVAYALPTSSRERAMAKEHASELQQAVHVTSDVGRDVAGQALSDLKPELQQAGADVAETAQRAVSEVKDEARGAADSVKDAATSGPDQGAG